MVDGEIMEIKIVSINKIKPYEKNPRKNDDAVDAVANSIKEFGWQQPIVVDSGGVIIAGHTRYKAAKKLKLEEVPIVVTDKLTKEQVNAYRLADNKSGELACWDDNLLDQELNNILDIDMSQFGFSLDDDLAEEDVIDDDYEEDTPIVPNSKPGQIYQLGRHRLMCGDSTNPEDVEKLMNNQLADLLITDPPYNVAYEGKQASKMTIMNDKLKDDQFYNFLLAAFSNAKAVMKAGASFYVWFSSLEAVNFRKSLENSELSVHQELIWEKNNFTLGYQDYRYKHEPCLYGWVKDSSHSWYSDRKQTTILKFDKPQRADLHPTMKPIPLFDYQIKNSSKSGDIVLDLFGGSGTTLIACEQNGRNAYLMEFDPRYVDVIIDRWEKFTGNKAKLIQN